MFLQDRVAQLKKFVLKTLSISATIAFCGTIIEAQSLSSAVQTALTSNPRIKAQDSSVRAAAYDLLQTREQFEPTLSLFGTVGREYVDDPAGLSAADNAVTKTPREAGLLAEVTLYDGFRRDNLTFARASRLDRSMFEYLDASETMALTVVQAYVDVARQLALKQIALDHLARHIEIQGQVSRQVTGGKLPISDLLQVESRVERVRVALTEIELDLSAARIRYRELVGQLPGSYLKIPAPPAPPSTVDLLVKASLDNNFRIKQAQSNIDAREFERRMSEADYQPRITLQAGTSYGADLDGSRGHENRNFVGLNLNWTLFRGGRRERTEAFAERRNEALYDRMSIMREVDAIARRAWTNYSSNRRLQQLLAKQVETNQELVFQYLQEFQLATRSLIDVLIAETELFTARYEQINSRASLSFSGYRMMAAQSKLAKYFGVDSTGELLLLTVGVDTEKRQRPYSVLQKGRPVVDR
ncbi:TolC family protein [Primorskyibacter sp. S87]|uniref:TolC family protein n=1 Tax=Primorskyibacter sp. S87 TaxID=3415126 RepID=UPI003C79C744